ncbi:unnamed protein product [Onchocerca ochengi]|uniref:Transcription repressor n=1 Tax=Onchocerca ochengi TaxID=42157 RepID=A0A182E6Q0_ONCOC|nr:unnamed protein product [Onchocerca ochengi]VDK70111.1 unnamed protein product [Onchocerca ochengi]
MDKFAEKNQNHSAESADNVTLQSSPSNCIYLSPDNNFRCDSVRSMSIVGDTEMHARRILSIKRNGTVPNLSQDASSSGNHQPFLHKYLQVPQSHTSQSGRSNSSVASMQSDLESCIGDMHFEDELLDGKAIDVLRMLCCLCFAQLKSSHKED